MATQSNKAGTGRTEIPSTNVEHWTLDIGLPIWAVLSRQIGQIGVLTVQEPRSS
jgi:hypothetical protein